MRLEQLFLLEDKNRMRRLLLNLVSNEIDALSNLSSDKIYSYLLARAKKSSSYAHKHGDTMRFSRSIKDRSAYNFYRAKEMFYKSMAELARDNNLNRDNVLDVVDRILRIIYGHE